MNEITEAEFLKSYDVTKYERPSVTCDMVIFTVINEEEANYRKLPKKVLRVLLINRKAHPYKGKWALPGGFVNMDESLDEAAKRELKEETNIENIYMEQLYTYGDVYRDPRTRVISCSYMSLIDSTLFDVKAGDDAKDAQWFDVSDKLFEQQKSITNDGYILTKLYKLILKGNESELNAVIKVTIIAKGKNIAINREVLESNGIAFDHALIIHYGLERLRTKIEYTDIAFSLMPEKFTLTEFQQVYEVILDTELLKANFRRKISEMVIETNQYKADAGHRPSKLYRFNPNWEEIER
ncbi:MAG: ADP-ribose pyrophosphatase [Haloplasmataceae bacterium]|jgi:ADP-ribose pyrophosphatase YjhB (NUDIX family)|nr:ADP-ribose pyrophosphatase [Haloplasmataceae bacterium]